MLIIRKQFIDRSYFRFCFYVLLFLLVQENLLILNAQETSGIEEQNDSIDLLLLPFDLPEIELREATVKSLNNYSVLSARDIAIQDQKHISQSLNNVSGVYMHSGALNTNRITIRGIGSRSPFGTNKIKAFMDEIPLTNGVGETGIEDLDLSFVDQVEVWKGPTTSRYGAGLGGMIQLKTPDPSKQEEYMTMEGYYGSYGYNRLVHKSLYTNPKINQVLFYSLNKTHSDGYRDNNEYDRYSITLLNRSKVLTGVLSILVNHLNQKAFIPSSLNEEDYETEPSKAAFTWGRVKGFEDYKKTMLGLSYKSGIKDVAELTMVANLFHYDSYESRPFNILRENSLATNGRLLVNSKPFINNRATLNFGMEYYQEQYDWETFQTNDGALGDALSINEESRNYQNVFSEFQFRINNRLKFKTGLNYNNTSYDLTDLFPADSTDISGEYSFDNIWSPRIVLSYLPGNFTQIYLSASHGFSPPTLEETLKPDGLINTDIQPETGWSYELGGRGSLIQNKLAWEVSLYSMQIRNLLVARRLELDQYIGVNAGETQHNGLELDLNYSIVKKSDRSINFKVAYAYQSFNFQEFQDDENDYSGNELTGTSPHLLNAILSGSFKGLYGNLHFNYVDAMPLRDDNSVYSDSYSLLNLKLGYTKQFGERIEIDVFGGIANLLDEKYASMHLINASSFGGNAPRYYYPGLPRNYYGGIVLKCLFELD